MRSVGFIVARLFVGGYSALRPCDCLSIAPLLEMRGSLATRLELWKNTVCSETSFIVDDAWSSLAYFCLQLHCTSTQQEIQKIVWNSECQWFIPSPSGKVLPCFLFWPCYILLFLCVLLTVFVCSGCLCFCRSLCSSDFIRVLCLLRSSVLATLFLCRHLDSVCSPDSVYMFFQLFVCSCDSIPMFFQFCSYFLPPLFVRSSESIRVFSMSSYVLRILFIFCRFCSCPTLFLCFLRLFACSFDSFRAIAFLFMRSLIFVCSPDSVSEMWSIYIELWRILLEPVLADVNFCYHSFIFL